MPTKRLRSTIDNNLSEKEKEFCDLVISKVAKKLGWENEVEKNTTCEGASFYSKRIWCYIPENSSFKASIFAKNRIRTVDISLYAKKYNYHNWTALIHLIKYFGGDVVSTDFMKAIKYLDYLIENTNKKGERSPTV